MGRETHTHMIMERKRGERCGEGNTHTYDNGERERREMRGGKHTHMIMERERGERCVEGNTHTYDNGERERREIRGGKHTHIDDVKFHV